MYIYEKSLALVDLSEFMTRSILSLTMLHTTKTVYAKSVASMIDMVVSPARLNI